jgi:hypothetical protein
MKYEWMKDVKTVLNYSVWEFDLLYDDEDVSFIALMVIVQIYTCMILRKFG